MLTIAPSLLSVPLRMKLILTGCILLDYARSFCLYFSPGTSQSYFHGDYCDLWNITYFQMKQATVLHMWETLDLGHGLDNVAQRIRFFPRDRISHFKYYETGVHRVMIKAV